MSDLEQLLQPTFAAKHVKAALKQFQAMTTEFQQGAWEEAIGKGGKFVEAALKALYIHVGKTLPAARELHASMAGTTMAVAMGESVANMIQPFFALPLLAIAGLPMRRMMGFMVISFLVALVAFGISLLVLLPHS